MSEEKKVVDLYRDTPVRYLGYANEVGESFRSIVPVSLVRASYGISISYVLADTFDKGKKAYQTDTSEQKMRNVSLSMTDTLLWQMLASVVIPGFTINRICAGVQFFQKRSNKPILKNRWLATAVGLISIPFIIHPIDQAVEEGMNVTYRKWVGYRPS